MLHLDDLDSSGGWVDSQGQLEPLPVPKQNLLGIRRSVRVKSNRLIALPDLRIVPGTSENLFSTSGGWIFTRPPDLQNNAAVQLSVASGKIPDCHETAAALSFMRGPLHEVPASFRIEPNPMELVNGDCPAVREIKNVH